MCYDEYSIINIIFLNLRFCHQMPVNYKNNTEDQCLRFIIAFVVVVAAVVVVVVLFKLKKYCVKF